MPTLDEILITGQPGELDWYQYLYLEELQRQRERDATPADPNSAPDPAFAPPTVPLPVEPPPVVQPKPIRVIPGAGVAAGILRGVVWFLFPQPTGPREHDELDPFDVIGAPPPPSQPPPGSTDPIMPPNWNDMLEWPGIPRYVPLTPIPIEMPPGEPEVIVSPPRPKPNPTVPDEVDLPSVVELPNDYGVDYRPGPAPAPDSPPGIDPVSPGLDPQLDPFRVPAPDRPSAPAPDIFSPTLPDGFGDPIADPFTPSPLPTPPSTTPRVPTIPDFFAPPLDPELTPEPIITPILTQFQPDPFTTKDQCDCAKKKKKKKREDRRVCYRGTYVETKRGLSKKRLEEVPCEGAAKRSTGSTKPATKKLKPGQFPGLGLVGGMDGGQISELLTHAFKEFAPILLERFAKKAKPVKAKKPKRNRRGKTKLPKLPGTPYSTPFPFDLP